MDLGTARENVSDALKPRQGVLSSAASTLGNTADRHESLRKDLTSLKDTVSQFSSGWA